MSAVQSYVAIAQREGLTLRQMAMRSAAAKHHWTLVGSVKQVADELESWFLEGAADGFNVLPSDAPGAINTLADKLVPELQRRGLFHTEYEGRTFTRKSWTAPTGGSIKALLIGRGSPPVPSKGRVAAMTEGERPDPNVLRISRLQLA